MKEKVKEKIKNNIEFNEIISDIITNPEVMKMRRYRQHFSTTCFDHCLEVAYFNYKICKFLHLDYRSATRGGMLHDFFLYDWREPNSHEGIHAFVHGKIAYQNAIKLFDINKKEKDIIIKHMWPIYIGFPIYLETYITTIVDKYCATVEAFDNVKISQSLKKAFRYTYLYIVLFFMKKQ